MSNQLMNRLSVVAIAGLLAACGGGEEAAAPAASGTEAHKAAEPAKAEAPKAEEAAAGAYTVAAVADGGKVAGKVTLTGAAPAAEEIEVTKDNATCGAKKMLEPIKAGADGALSNVVVWIDGITSGKDWASKDGSIDQKGCEYTPHIQGVPQGGEFTVKNSDPVLHNIHAYTGEETLFNIAQPMQNQESKKKLSKAGPVEFKCDVHSWMHAWVFVASSPYFAVTGADGTFSIADVPPGTYKAKAWQEKLGLQEMEVKVDAKGEAKADFAFAMK